MHIHMKLFQNQVCVHFEKLIKVFTTWPVMTKELM
jgi:hypothetical protein